MDNTSKRRQSNKLNILKNQQTNNQILEKKDIIELQNITNEYKM